MTTQPLDATYTAKNVFGQPSTGRIEKYQAAHDALGRRVLELYFADTPDLIVVYPYDTVTERNLKTVGITCIKTGWLLNGQPFDSGVFFPVNWSIKYRRDKMNDYQLIEVVDMVKKTVVSEVDELQRQIEVLKKNKGFSMYGAETQIKVQHLLFAKFDVNNWEALPNAPTYTRALALSEMAAIIDRQLADMNSIPQITQEQLDREIAASVGMTPDGKPLPVADKSDADVLNQLKTTDVVTDLTPSPDAGRVDELGPYLQGLPNGAPNGDPKPLVEINATPSVNGREAPKQKTVSTETEVSKIEASTPVSDKLLTADDWGKWEKEQADNLSIEVKDVRALLNITPESTYRRYTALEIAGKDLKVALDTRKMMDQARRIFDDFGVPAEIGLRWIDEMLDKTVGETLEEIAESWRAAESFLARLKTKSVEYGAEKGSQPSALTTIEPNDKASVTTPANGAIRSIPVPNPNELAAMKELAAIAGDTHFYKGIANYGQAMMVMYTGFELGLGLTFSLKHIPVVNGSPWPDAECHRALAWKSGFVEWMDVKGDNTQATFSIRRKGQTEIQTVTYTIEDARQAGLTGNATYTKHPADMLVARASIRGVRRFVPEAGAGIIGDTENMIPDEVI